MSAIEWLERNAPGFANLSRDERELIMHFSLLWSLFEGDVLNASAGVKSIEQAVAIWNERGLITQQTFSGQLAYFRDRYYANGAFTDRFDHLHLDRSGNPQVVLDVLSGGTTEPEKVACALLIIVLRFRNNLFHGEKWAYELRGQKENFTHANTILMRVIELAR
jgi:hypothetical protein